MSKKQKASVEPPVRRGKYGRLTIIVGIALALAFAGAALALRGPGIIATRDSAAPQQSQSGFAPASPVKEYVYAGGRLVATEEPVSVAPPTPTPNPTPTPGQMTVYDAVADFSAGQNPGGAWSYGYRASGGGAFASLTSNYNVYELPPNMHTWYFPNAYNLPAVIHNGTGATQSFFGATQPTMLLNLYPGAFGEKSIVRWTAQGPGTAQIAGRFEGLDATTTNVLVVKNNSVTLFSGNVTSMGNQVPFSSTLTVVAGDTIEFQVAYNNDIGHDSTGLAATITVQGQPPPLTFNAVNDFSAGQNPGGAWSYGSLTGSSFALLPNSDNLFRLGDGLHTRYLPNPYNLPAIIHNGTGATQAYFTATHPPDMLNLYPGGSGEKAVVRWTAPRAGTAQIAGRFQGLDATTTDVSVAHNGAGIASGNINGLGNQSPFTLMRTVAAGDTIEFRVGYGNGSASSDHTGLSVTITLQ